MPVNLENYKEISSYLEGKNVTLIAVSKTKPVEDILELYNLGQRNFGENYVQELVEKYQQLPDDIRWHFIGHLQTNKVKLIAPFVHLIQSVDSEKLLKEINKEAEKNNRSIDCLLEVHIAQEETKFGLDENELQEIFKTVKYNNTSIIGLMGMASFADDIEIVKREFQSLKLISHKYVASFDSTIPILSMGMSGDFKLAIEKGSNMVRIGSLLFGQRGSKV